MPDTTTGAATSQADAAAQPQEGASQDSQTSQADAATSGSSTVARELAEARQEAARYRTALREREEADRKADEQKLSDAERASRHVSRIEAENTDLKSKLVTAETQFAVFTEAHDMGFTRPIVAYRIIAADIEYDDTGRPKNVTRLLTALLKDMPELSSATARPTGSAEGGVRGGAAVPTDMNAMIRQAAGVRQ